MRLLAALLASLLLLLGGGAAPVALWMIGDSTMADKPDPAGNPERGWGQALPRFLDPTVVVRNHAVNGRSTRSFLAEGRWDAVRTRLRAGDYVVVQFGHNDAKVEDPARHADAEGAYRRNLERFVDEARARGATPVLATPIVRRRFDADGVLRDTHGAYPGVVRAVARARDVPLLDLERLTRALVQRAGPERSKALYVWVAPRQFPRHPAARQDDTHLSPAGADSVARLAARALRDAGLPLGAHVRGVD